MADERAWLGQKYDGLRLVLGAKFPPANGRPSILLALIFGVIHSGGQTKRAARCTIRLDALHDIYVEKVSQTIEDLPFLCLT